MNPYQRGQRALCGDYFKSTPDGAGRFKRAGRWHKQPQKGDVIFYFSEALGRIGHTGVVDEVPLPDLAAVEGNTSGAEKDRNGGECRRKVYRNFKVGDMSWPCGFGRPIFDDETCTVEEFLEVVRGEIGYEEKATPRNLEDKHANRGKNNYTKYGVWYNHGKVISEPWCGELVSWCFYQACKLHQERNAAATNQEPRKEGWIQQNDKWLYYKDGTPVCGKFEYINGRWYVFDNAGFMIKGWFKSEEGWYYLGEDGAMLSGQWLQDKGKWYYLTKSGLMATSAKVKKARGDGYDFVGTDGVYNPVLSFVKGNDSSIEIAE